MVAVLLAGVGAQWLAWRLGLPSILLLLLVGLALGPLSGWVNPDELLGTALFPLVSLAVAVVLFEGGLTLDLRELRRAGPAIGRLATIGLVVTWTGTTLCAWGLGCLPLPLAVLFGALMTVTGPTVVGPLLRQVRPTGSVGIIARWEGIVVDPLGAALAVVTLAALLGGGGAAATVGAVGGLLRTTLAGAFLGALGAGLVHFPLRRFWVPDHLQSPVVLTIVLAVFTAGQAAAPEGGLLAVTLMGLLLANQKSVPIAHVVEFKENLRVLLLAVLFVTLGARVRLEDLALLDGRAFLLLAALILIVRPIAVAAAMRGTGMRRQERWFLSALAPRGVVAAAVSVLFAERLAEAGVPGAEALVPLTFLMILGTVTVYGLSLGPLARALGLARGSAQGVLIAGADGVARSLADGLRLSGIAVLLVDSNRADVAAARRAGLSAAHASILADSPKEIFDLGGMGQFLALTPNDEVNALACLHYRDLFDRSRVFQLAPEPIMESEAGATGTSIADPQPHREDGALREYGGRTPFRTDATHALLARRLRRGHRVLLLDPAPADGDLREHLRSEGGADAIALFVLGSGEGDQRTVTITTPEAPETLNEGERLLALVAPAGDGSD
jgi:NhaP-type Na+/H+ or K+/H+ antiporter